MPTLCQNPALAGFFTAFVREMTSSYKNSYIVHIQFLPRFLGGFLCLALGFPYGNLKET